MSKIIPFYKAGDDTWVNNNYWPRAFIVMDKYGQTIIILFLM